MADRGRLSRSGLTRREKSSRERETQPGMDSFHFVRDNEGGLAWAVRTDRGVRRVQPTPGSHLASPLRRTEKPWNWRPADRRHFEIRPTTIISRRAASPPTAPGGAGDRPQPGIAIGDWMTTKTLKGGLAGSGQSWALHLPQRWWRSDAWRDCAPCHSQPDGARHGLRTSPPTTRPQGLSCNNGPRPPSSCRCGCLRPIIWLEVKRNSGLAILGLTLEN